MNERSHRMSANQIYAEATQSIVSSDKDKALEVLRRGLAEGEDAIELMKNGFVPGIEKVGDLFGRGELFLPELLIAAGAMKAVTDLINETLPEAAQALHKGGSVLIGTVAGDSHDIGKSIVVSLLRANGVTVHDLGRDVAIEAIIEKATELDVDIIGTSALLTTTMIEQRKLEEELKKAGLRDRFKTIVGGAPVTARWATRIGADAYAEDAQDAVKTVNQLLGL
jgi:trimethylamine corrinoid protein